MGVPGLQQLEGGAIIADGPAAVDFYALLALKHGLAFEVKTGMKKSRVNLLDVARRYGFDGRTKKQALEYITNLVALEGDAYA